MYLNSAGDVGEPGDKGPVGKAIEGPAGDQGDPGMYSLPQSDTLSMQLVNEKQLINNLLPCCVTTIKY